MMPVDPRSSSDPSPWERYALASGIAFALLQLLMMGVFGLFILPNLGAVDAPVAERAAAYVQFGDRLRLGNYLLTLPTVFFLLFLGGLHAVLRRAEGGSGAFAMASVLSGAAMAMLWPLAGVISDIGIDIARAGGDPATVSSLDAIAPYSLALSALPRTVLLVAGSAVLLQSGIVPRWLGWAGLTVGGLSLVGTATLATGALFPVLALSTLLFELWLIALCVVLLRSQRAADRTANPGVERAPA